MSIQCCACREPVGEVVEAYSNHDEACKLIKFRCGQYECAWCDMCDVPEPNPEPYRVWKKIRQRPPTKEAMDLSSLTSGSSDTHR